MSNIRRDLQYLKSLKAQREQKREQVQELESQIARLRKNPTDKLTSDLVIFSNNKKKDILKEEISSIDKEIYHLNAQIQSSEDLDDLSQDEIEEYGEELNDIFPEPELEPEPETVEPEQEDTPQAEVKPSAPSVFSKLIKGYKSLSKLVVSAVVSLLLLWTLFQWDTGNLLYYFNRVTRFNFFCFLIFGFFALSVTSYLVYKGITKKPFGSISDFFILIILVCSVGVLGLYINLPTTFKLLIFAFLAIYSLVYYIIRLCLYQKDLKQIASKNRFFKYYYNLFTSISPLVIALITVSCFILLYLSMTTRLFRRWLASSDAHKVMIIIDIVLIALAYLYAGAFSVVRINEPKVYLIDLFALTSELVAVGFFFINNFISAKATASSVIIVILALIFALGINIYRIIKTKK